MKRVLFLLAAVFLCLTVFFTVAVIGYEVSALLCLGLSGVCLVYGLTYRRDTKRKRALFWLVTVGLCAALVLFAAAEVPVIADARSDTDTSADWVIVMGAGVQDGRPSLSLLDRLTAAEAWLTQHPEGRAVLSGSQGPNETVSEAQCMLDWLVSQGIDPDRLYLEEQADNSLENLTYSLDIIRSQNGDTVRVALLSSEYHLHRLRRMAEALGCDPVLVAAKTSRISLRINYTIREAAAMWKYRLSGRI